MRFLKSCLEYGSTGVVATADVVKACKGVNVAVLIGGCPLVASMELKDLISENVPIFKAQASALEQHAAADCKVRHPIHCLHEINSVFNSLGHIL
jgi:malate/lactate dehydrogenase